MGTFRISGTGVLRRAVALAVTWGAVCCAGLALAQTTTPQTIPGLDTFSLPASRPTPQSTPSASPTTNPRPTPAATRTPVTSPPVARTPSAPRPSPTPVARPVPALAQPLPAVTGTPTLASPPQIEPLPDPLPIPLPSPTPVPLVAWERVDPVAVLALAIVAVFAGVFGLGFWWRNRPVRERVERRVDKRHEVFALGTGGRVDLPPPPAPPASAPPAPPAPPPPMPVPQQTAPDPTIRALIEIELIPRRAGTNLLSAAVEYQVIVTNRGTLTAHNVRLDIRLLSAGAGQDAELAALFADPIAEPVTHRFAVPVGKSFTLDGMVMHPRETLALLDMPGALFVPVLAINLRYAWAGGAVGQVARAFVIGIDRGGDRLQPFRRDVARMYDTVAGRPYPVSVDV